MSYDYKDNLRTQLRVKNILLFLCGAGIVVSVFLLLVFIRTNVEYIKYLVIVAVVCGVLIKPLSKAQKKDKAELKRYEDKEKADREARKKGQNPANKFNLNSNIKTTNALLGGSSSDSSATIGQGNQDDYDPLNRFKYNKKP